MVQAVPHAAALIRSTRRYCLTAAGVRRLAQDEGTKPDGLLRRRPVSEGWRRILLERLDALATIYRVAVALSNGAYPIQFRWYRPWTCWAPGLGAPRSSSPG